MAGTTSVPRIQFTPAGLITPDETAVKAGVLADMNAAFGGNLNPADSTPQGQLIASNTALIGAKNDEVLAFVNGVDPATSAGSMQDGIGKLYRLTRLPARATTVDVVCSGKTGTNITLGALVIDVSKNIYACSQAGVIPASGSVTLPFVAQVSGPIACPAGAIPLVGGIYKTILGWDSATNITDGEIGSDLESRVDFEFRRQQSVAANARDTLTAIQGEVINVSGVTDAYVTTNRSIDPLVIDGFTLSPKSVYVAAVGGVDQSIAEAIWRKVSVGAGFNGNTSATVTDDGDYNVPKPTYVVRFNRNDELPIYFAVTVQNLTATPNATVAASIRAAIVGAFFGADGGTRARIGSTILATRYIVPISSAAQVALLSVFIGTTPSPTGLSVAVQIDQYPSIDPNDIAVVFV